MNDEPTKSIIEAVNQYGWPVALLTASWGVVLRFVVGAYDRNAQRAEDRLASIEKRLTVIEGRSHNRRREDDDER
jgi:hypothetical protein